MLGIGSKLHRMPSLLATQNLLASAPRTPPRESSAEIPMDNTFDAMRGFFDVDACECHDWAIVVSRNYFVPCGAAEGRADETVMQEFGLLTDDAGGFDMTDFDEPRVDPRIHPPG